MQPAAAVTESARLAALRSYGILDTATDTRFDALAELAAITLAVPIALISFIDSDRQWFKSGHGITACELPRDAFCDRLVATAAPLIVADALQEKSFVSSPLVAGDPGARFFAGVPLCAPSGETLGALCVIDREPKQLTDPELVALTLLADQIVALLTLLRATSRHRTVERDLNQLMATLDSTKDAILIFDPQSLQFSYANKGAVDHTGYRVDELLEMTPLHLKPLFDEPQYRQLLEPLITGQSPVATFETLHRHKSGHDMPVEIVLQYLAPPGEQPRFINIARDISERYRADKLKGEFVSMVSHELRTPLTSIRGALGLVARGITGTLPKQAEEYIDIALSNCERLVRLINDILDVEKIQSGGTELSLELVDLLSVVKKAAAANESFAISQNVQLVLANELSGVEVLADEDRLIQVLTNLISNAAKFSPDDQVVTLSMEIHEARVRVCVSDCGPGIPEDFKPRIFQRFAQADSSNSRTRGGTGLGLSISKSLIEAMKGAIGFETTAGEGTTFYFDLPALIKPSEIEVRSGGDEEQRVLVCEDDLDAAHLITKALEQLGCSVHVAPTLVRARELLSQFAYRIVTLDLTLADGQAGSLVAEIRRNSVNADVPVIAITGATAEQQATLLGPAPESMVDILQKPVAAERLAEVVRDLLAHRDEAPLVLHVEDDEDVRRIVQRLLPQNWTVVGAGTVTEAKSHLDEKAFDLVLLDLSLPDGGGEVLLDRVGDAQVVVFAGDDVTARFSQRIAKSFVKTRTTELQLRDTVVTLMANRTDR